jgi:hypothetical protein
LRDPATGLTKLRAAGPVVEVHFPIVGKTWITTTSDLAGRVLKDSDTFSMRSNGRVGGLRWWMPGWLRTTGYRADINVGRTASAERCDDLNGSRWVIIIGVCAAGRQNCRRQNEYFQNGGRRSSPD